MVWESIKKSLQQSVSPSEYGLWIKPIICHHTDDSTLELHGPDRFFCSWVEDKYLDLIKAKLYELGVSQKTVRLSAANAPENNSKERKCTQLKLPGIVSGSSNFRSLHPAYTFDQFMVGESNLLARSACSALARGEKTYGNCLFVNSSTGLGKSHLTQAVAHEVLQTAPSTRLQYLTAQQFSAEMVRGIQSKSMDMFTKKYINNCDMLMVEDVHTLKGKTKTQEELNNILDYLIKSGKRVIFTSATDPIKLDGIDEDFKSRMTSGLVTRINTPDLNTRFNIIQHKAAVNNLLLSESSIELLAKSLHGDVRKTESALIGIKAKSNLLSMDPDEALIKEVLEGIIGRPMELSGEMIKEFISGQYKVSVAELQSRSRKRNISSPRQIAMYLTRKYTDLSLASIGQLYQRDHSTVLYAIKTVNKSMTQASSKRKQVEMLCDRLDVGQA